jgi:hypothetical protein
MEPLNGVALGYGLDNRGFESRQGVVIYLFTTTSRPGLGPIHPPVQWVPRALSLGLKRPEREADHSIHLVPSSRMRGTIPPLRQYAFMAWCLVKKKRIFERACKVRGPVQYVIICSLFTARTC